MRPLEIQSPSDYEQRGYSAVLLFENKDFYISRGRSGRSDDSCMYCGDVDFHGIKIYFVIWDDSPHYKEVDALAQEVAKEVKEPVNPEEKYPAYAKLNGKLYSFIVENVQPILPDLMAAMKQKWFTAGQEFVRKSIKTALGLEEQRPLFYSGEDA